MYTKAHLSIADCNVVLEAALAEAKRQGWAVAIAVVDDGGHLLAMQRMDQCAALSAYVAVEKARCAALGRKETKVFEEMINQGRYAFLSAPQVSATLEGGIPVRFEGQIVAAVGVSGVLPQQDAQVAQAGINALAMEAA